MLKTDKLIQVQTIKKSHAQQIQWVDKPDLKDIMKAIHPEKGDLSVAEVVGRVPGRTLKDIGQVNANSVHWCYLIRTPIGLFWMNAPDRTSLIFKTYEKLFPQLFV